MNRTPKGRIACGSQRWLCVALLLGVAMMAACQGDPRAERRRRKEVAINIGENPGTLNPVLCSSVNAQKAISCFLCGLICLDADMHIRPDLAESWTVSRDGLTVEFMLRPAKWANGEPLTAEDFLYTYRRFLDPKVASETASFFFYIKGAREYYEHPERGWASVGITAPAPDRLRFTLVNPTPFFIQLVGACPPIYRRVAEANPDWDKRAETYIGNGPFIMESFTPGHRITARKNPLYWNAANVGIERLTLLTIENEVTERIAFDNGEIDATCYVPDSDLNILRSRPEFKTGNILGVVVAHFNCQRPPFQDVRVRRALGLAVDRKSLVEHVTQGGQPAFLLSPVDLYRKPPAPTFKDAAFAESRALLAEAGFPGGKGFPKVTLMASNYSKVNKVVQVLQENWRKELGIQVEIQTPEIRVLSQKGGQGDFDILLMGWNAFDPMLFLEFYESACNLNYSHWKDAEFDAKLKRVRVEADLELREALLRDAETYWALQMPAAPLFTNVMNYLVAPGLDGYEVDPGGGIDVTKLRWAVEKK